MKKSVISERPLVVGDIVKYKEGRGHSWGWARIKSIRGRFCNLCTPFGRQIIEKGVLIDTLIEDQEAWYRAWQQTESYQCM